MKTEDLIEIAKFTKEFNNTFEGFESYKQRKFKDYLGYGAESIYTKGKPKKFEDDKYQRNVREGILWLSTDINPHGVTGADDIDRTYSILFEQKCDSRGKYGRNWNEVNLIKFYGYSRNIEGIIEKFKRFVEGNEYLKHENLTF